jgi:hypothetical protein
MKKILIAAALALTACVGVPDDPIGTEQEELRYSCGLEGGGCYCCYGDDAYGGCCVCPVGGARCR